MASPLTHCAHSHACTLLNGFEFFAMDFREKKRETARSLPKSQVNATLTAIEWPTFPVQPSCSMK